MEILHENFPGFKRLQLIHLIPFSYKFTPTFQHVDSHFHEYFITASQ